MPKSEPVEIGCQVADNGVFKMVFFCNLLKKKIDRIEKIFLLKSKNSNKKFENQKFPRFDDKPFVSLHKCDLFHFPAADLTYGNAQGFLFIDNLKTISA